MKKKLLTLLFMLSLMLVIAFSVSAETTVTPSADNLGDCIINGETVSGDELPVTQGMSYTVIDEEAKTVALSSRGSTDSFTGAVVIPSTIKIDGVNYTVVQTNANVFANTSITKAYVPDTVVEILGLSSGTDNGTFANCFYLSEVYIGTGIKVIGRFAFTSIGKTSTVKVFYVAGKVQELGEYAFNAANFSDDCEITFDSTDMRIIGPRVFDNGSKSLKKIDSKKLESIGERGFASSKSLEYILIPEYCTVGLYAFNGTDNLQTAIILSADDEIKEIPKEMFSSGTSGYKTNIYIKGKVEATEWAVLPGRAFNIYMDSYENAKYFADSIMKYQHSGRIANGTWYFCTPYNGYYCFSSNGSFGLTAKTDVTEAPHTAIYSKGVETQATCNQYAGVGDICEVCGAYFNVIQTGSEYDENAHNYSWVSHTDPQCTQTGLDVYECIYCKDQIEEVISVLGHDYAQEIIEPTCSLIGYTNNVCTRCEYSIITDKVDTVAHSYLGNGFALDGINISYNTSCKYCGVAGDSVKETLVNKCYIEGYGIFNATLEYLTISVDGTVTPSDVSFDNAVIYFPSYVEIDGTVVEVKTIQGFKELSIKGVYIPDTITTIEESCFRNVYNLKNIVVGKGITELEAYAFNMYGQNVTVDEFIFTNTITKMGAGCIGRIFQASSDIPYQFNTCLTYVGSLVSVGDRTGGTILREVYITNGCDLTEKFAFNGSNGLKRAYIEGGETEAEAKELTQELFSGDAKGLEILIQGYVKATGQAVLPTGGALLFFETFDQAKVFAATVKAQGYPERGNSSAWYICESDELRYLLDNYTTVASEITFKIQGTNYPHYHAGLTTTTESTCTQGGTVTSSCFSCGKVLENTVADPLPHNYNGGVFVTEPICCVLGSVKYTCLVCDGEKYVATGFDLSAHNLDTENGATIVDIAYANGFLASGTQIICCASCKENIEGEQTAPIYKSLGYSYSKTGSIMQGFAVNNEVLSLYQKVTGKQIGYGLVVAVKDVVNTTNLVGTDEKATTNKVAVASFTGKDYDLFEMKINGIGESNRDTEIYICAYYILDNKVYYIDNGVAGREAPLAVTYNKIAAFVENNTPLE